MFVKHKIILSWPNTADLFKINDEDSKKSVKSA